MKSARQVLTGVAGRGGRKSKLEITRRLATAILTAVQGAQRLGTIAPPSYFRKLALRKKPWGPLRLSLARRRRNARMRLGRHDCNHPARRWAPSGFDIPILQHLRLLV